MREPIQALTRIIIPVGYGDFEITSSYYESGECNINVRLESGTNFVFQFPGFNGMKEFADKIADWANCQSSSECEYKLMGLVLGKENRDYLLNTESSNG